MKRYQYTINPQIAKVVSTKEFIQYFSLGQNLEKYSQSSHSAIEVDFDVVKDLSYDTRDSQKFHFFYGHYGKQEVFYERPLSIGIKLKMEVKNLLDHPRIIVNNPYFKYIRFKADNAYPPGIHLLDILLVNLLERMYSPLHCAAISSPENEGILLVAPPDTGKTLTSFLALNKGFHFLAEDIAFVDEKYVYANPYTSTFLHGDQFGNGKSGKSLRSLVKSIPTKFDLLQYYTRPPKKSITDLVKGVKIDEKATIKNIFILDRGETSTQRINPEDAARRILIINRNEFSYFKNPLIFAYSYFNSSLDVNKLMRIEEQIINTIVNTRDCFLLKSNDPKKYFPMMLDAIK